MTSNRKKTKTVKEQPMTYDDYAALPDDGKRYELVEGVLEMMSPSPSVKHQLVSSEIQYKLKQTCDDEYVILNAPIDVILSEVEVRQPDLILIHRKRLNIVTKKGVEGSPDLVVEILSPTSFKRDKVSKLRTYAQYQIAEYWIVDPSNCSLEQYVLQEEDYLLKDVFTKEEEIQSQSITCASFSMFEIMSNVPDLS